MKNEELAMRTGFFNRLRASSPRRLARPGLPRPQPGRYPLNTGNVGGSEGGWMPAWRVTGILLNAIDFIDMIDFIDCIDIIGMNLFVVQSYKEKG